VATAGSIPPWDGAVALDVAAARRWIVGHLEPKAPIEVALARPSL
jgi:hypothetical protein